MLSLTDRLNRQAKKIKVLNARLVTLLKEARSNQDIIADLEKRVTSLENTV